LNQACDLENVVRFECIFKPDLETLTLEMLAVQAEINQSSGYELKTVDECLKNLTKVQMVDQDEF
jgi:hypothetical protein